ncbi:MAG: hypothetical protein JSU75_05585 [Gammaproteobacteria bacterium]|nr:MAG: hypothetical protein JSU75_05585 [Gammaproteobacteria bacterium]
MQRVLDLPGKLATAGVLIGVLLFAQGVAAADDWELDLEITGWLPIIETESEDGKKSKITRDDFLDTIDLFGFWFIRFAYGKWSLSSDFVYFKISEGLDAPLFGAIPDLAKLTDVGMQSWVIRPAIGYEIFRDDRQFVELYAGGRYLWIESDLEFDLDPILPGGPSGSRKDSFSEGSWDGIVGVRGSYHLNDKWYFPYSVNAGTGESDFTWEAKAAAAYRLKHFDAIAGWRYLYYDFDSDALLKELDASGPYAGVVFHW